MKKSLKVKSQTLITVNDVGRSGRWYQKLLNLKSGHGGDEYEQLICGKEMILQLHVWDQAHDHGHLGKKSVKSRGNGVLIWFEVPDFDETFARAKKLKAKVLLKPHVNPNAGHRECWLKDPDGYTVVFAGK
jgi:predicted enzyme related to lactoylglutathione lyase